MRILVVEDDPRIADFLMRALHAEGHTCNHAATGEEALSITKNGDFEILILDLMLPGISGLDVCQEIRIRNIQVPILMLTAMDSVEDIVQGLRMGADDYMTKPFDLEVLLARIEAITRRFNSDVGAIKILEVSNVSFNRESKVVKVDEIQVDLTAKEIALLELLMLFPEKLFSRERILNNIWGTNTDPLTNVVDVYVGRLRRKLGKDNSPFIETIRGMGYRIDPKIR